MGYNEDSMRDYRAVWFPCRQINGTMSKRREKHMNSTAYPEIDPEVLAAVEGICSTISVISFVVGVLTIVANWVLFMKAGEAGWKSIIPIYNAYVLFQIVYGSGWKFLLCLIPVVGGIVSLMFYVRQAQAYGKGILFGILNIFFSPITTLILAFGNARYEGPVYSLI